MINKSGTASLKLIKSFIFDWIFFGVMIKSCKDDASRDHRQQGKTEKLQGIKITFGNICCHPLMDKQRRIEPKYLSSYVLQRT